VTVSISITLAAAAAWHASLEGYGAAVFARAVM
jgi:hypothetical protein